MFVTQGQGDMHCDWALFPCVSWQIVNLWTSLTLNRTDSCSLLWVAVRLHPGHMTSRMTHILQTIPAVGHRVLQTGRSGTRSAAKDYGKWRLDYQGFVFALLYLNWPWCDCPGLTASVFTCWSGVSPNNLSISWLILLKVGLSDGSRFQHIFMIVYLHTGAFHMSLLTVTEKVMS